MPRRDETQYRLLAWDADSAAAERLAVQVLLAHGFQDADPSHPYGGPDGGRDATFTKDGDLWVMAVYFPRHRHSFAEIKAKFKSDLEGAEKHKPKGLAFVTNQEVTLGERDELGALASGIEVEIFHMERIAALLDQPSMAELRKKFLGIDPGLVPLNLQLKVIGVGRFFTGGEDLRETLLEHEDDEVRTGAERLRSMSPVERERQALMAKMLSQEPPGDPPTVEEVEEFVADRRVQVERDWDRIEDYVAGMAWPALRFVVTNIAPSFLYDVKLVVAFDGAYGVEKDHPINFEDEKLLDPDYERPWDGRSTYMPRVDFAPPANYPVDWKNLDTSLEVRIFLAELPPGEAFRWDSEEYGDVVLVAPRTARSVRASWVAVARGHGTVFTGPDIELDVEEVVLPDAVSEIIRLRAE